MFLPPAHARAGTTPEGREPLSTRKGFGSRPHPSVLRITTAEAHATSADADYDDYDLASEPLTDLAVGGTGVARSNGSGMVGAAHPNTYADLGSDMIASAGLEGTVSDGTKARQRFGSAALGR
eukprot:6223863-Prymnesium_polylepis.1